MNEQQNTPELRFSEFKSVWKKDKLGTLIENNTILNQSDGNHGSLYPRKSEFINSGIPYISASNIKNNEIDFSNVKYLEMERAKQFKKGVAQNEDVLLAHNATVGPTALLKTEYPFVILSTTLTLYRLNKDKLNNHYFLYSLQSKNIQNQLTKLMKQTTRNQVPILLQRKMILTYPLDLAEQEKIGNFFSKLDRQIELEEEKLALLEQQKKGYMQKIFSQQLRFKDENGEKFPDWQTTTLGQLSDITTGSLDANAMVPNGKYKFFTCARETYQIDKYAFDTEALLISGNGANVGYIHYYKGKFNAYQRTYVLDNIQNDINFIKYYLERYLIKRIYSEKRDGNTPYITRSTLYDMSISIPLAKLEQMKISCFLTKLDNKIQNQSDKVELLKERKKGFLQKMFV